MANIMRDADALDRFVSVLEDYQDNIEQYCNVLNTTLGNTESLFSDENTKVAIDALYDIIADIRKLGDPVDQLILVLKKQVSIIDEAGRIFR